jgi:hypothetical protein
VAVQDENLFLTIPHDEFAIFLNDVGIYQAYGPDTGFGKEGLPILMQFCRSKEGSIW